LEDVTWGGESPKEVQFNDSGAALALKYAKLAGCVSKDRNCGRCGMNKKCPAILKEPWLNKQDLLQY